VNNKEGDEMENIDSGGMHRAIESFLVPLLVGIIGTIAGYKLSTEVSEWIIPRVVCYFFGGVGILVGSVGIIDILANRYQTYIGKR